MADVNKGDGSSKSVRVAYEFTRFYHEGVGVLLVDVRL